MSNRSVRVAKICLLSGVGVLLRRRLLEDSDRPRTWRVAWIVGPPGAGESSLSASYTETRPLSALWVRLAEDDGLPSLFRPRGVAARRWAPQWTPGPTFEVGTILGKDRGSRQFFERLMGGLPAPFAVALDDCQGVSEHSALHEVIWQGIDTLPQADNLLVLSRRERPVAQPHLVPDRGMGRIGGVLLRLTEEETRQIVRLWTRSTPSGEAIHTLQEQTEGWLAGATFMIEENEKGGNARPAGQSGYHRRTAVLDHLAREVGVCQEVVYEEFLLPAALLPRSTFPMVKERSGRAASADLPVGLSGGACPLEPLGPRERGFQVHPLFRTFLPAKGEATWTDSKRSRRQRCSAQMVHGAGEAEAVRTRIRQAGAWEDVIHRICEQAPALLASGESKRLQCAIRSVPQGVVEESSWLRYWLGVCLRDDDLPEALGHLEAAFAMFEAQKEATGIFLAWATVAEAILETREDFSRLDPWITILDKIVGESPLFPASEIGARVTVAAVMALVWRSPDHPDLTRWEERASEFLRSDCAPETRARLALALAQRSLWGGDLASAAAALEELRRTVEPGHCSPSTRILVAANQAIAAWLAGDLGGCRQASERALQIGHGSGVHRWDCLLWGGAACAALSGGKGVKAGELLQRMAEGGGRGIEGAQYHCLAAWRGLVEGEPDHAYRHAWTATQLSTEVGVPHVEALGRWLMAQALFERGQWRGAEESLHGAQAVACITGSKLLTYMCGCAAAQFSLAAGNQQAGRHFLREAMAIGREEGYTHFFGDRRDPMARLCTEAVDAGIEVQFVQGMVRRCNLRPETPPLATKEWPWAVKIYTFGRFLVLLDGTPVRFAGKAQKRPLELLRALIAFGGRDVGEERLSDALWPDANGDAAHRAFATTLHRLRKLLGHPDAIECREARLSLNPYLCCLDLWTFDHHLESLRAPAEHGREGDGRAIRDVEQAVALYRGPFLGDDPACWTLTPRERCRSRFLRATCYLGRYWEEAEQWERAIVCYQQGLEVDDLVEEFYQHLMACYLRLGRRADALATYHRCQRTLSTMLGVPPSPETERLYRAIHQAEVQKASAVIVPV